jgi:hypothetical protein
MTSRCHGLSLCYSKTQTDPLSSSHTHHQWAAASKWCKTFTSRIAAHGSTTVTGWSKWQTNWGGGVNGWRQHYQEHVLLFLACAPSCMGLLASHSLLPYANTSVHCALLCVALHCCGPQSGAKRARQEPLRMAQPQ